MADEHSTQIEDRDPERCVLTDRLLKALTYGGKRVGPDGTLIAGTKARTEGRRTVWDDWRDEHDQTTGLCIIITEKNAKTFKVVRRVKGEKRPVKYTLGRYDKGEVTLADARDQARKARDMMRKGVNPVEEERKERERKQREREQEKARVTFAEAAELYIAKCIIGEDPDDPELRTADTLEKQIRRDLLSRPWSRKAIVAVTKDDILQMVRDIKQDPKRSKPRRRSNAGATAFNHARRILAWAMKRDFGLGANVADRIDLDEEVGKKGSSRDRTLSDHEIRLFWRATGKMAYPGGTMLRLLFLSACRLREIAKAERSEFVTVDGAESIAGKMLVIPAGRMKGKKTKAVEHSVPIVPLMEHVLAEVPTFAGGGRFVFSKNAGRTPACNFSLLKQQVDETIAQVQREELGLPDGVSIPDEHRVPRWTFHDLRRSMRSLLSRAKVQPDIAERVLAHRIGGVRGTYDRWSFLPERRDALERGAALVERILANADNVFNLADRQAASA